MSIGELFELSHPVPLESSEMGEPDFQRTGRRRAAIEAESKRLVIADGKDFIWNRGEILDVAGDWPEYVLCDLAKSSIAAAIGAESPGDLRN